MYERVGMCNLNQTMATIGVHLRNYIAVVHVGVHIAHETACGIAGIHNTCTVAVLHGAASVIATQQQACVVAINVTLGIAAGDTDTVASESATADDTNRIAGVIEIGIYDCQVMNTTRRKTEESNTLTTDCIETTDDVVCTIEVAIEPVIVTGTDGRPLVLWRSDELVITVEHIGIEHDVIRQTVVLPLGCASIGVGNLRQISQLGTVGDLVGILLRTRTASKGVCHTAVPCHRLLGIDVEAGCYRNLSLGHREGIDIRSLLLQCNLLARGIIGQYKVAFGHQHVMGKDGPQIYLFSSLGTAYHLQYVAIHGKEFNGTAIGVGHSAHVGAIACSLVGIALTDLSQTIDIGIITIYIFERLAQQVSKLLALHFIGRLARGVSAIAVDGRVEVQLVDSRIIIVNTIVSALADRVALFNTSCT